jgi:FKBP-type peptidyl-prolyl cis-trans isomerase 2
MIKKPCELDTDFQRSISFQRNIEVWIEGKLDTVGKVEKYTDESVRIDGNHFMRAKCEFWIV